MQPGSTSTAWPNRLYKYRAVDPGCFRIISDNTLYFSGPRGFNDPFDSNADYLLQHDDLAVLAEELNRELIRQVAEWNLYANRAMDDNTDGFKRAGYKPYAPAPQSETLWAENDLFSSFFKKVTSEVSGKGTAKEGYRLLGDMIQRGYGICCLAARPDSILMWSHYADQHRGVALEFDSSQRLFRKTLGLSAHPVTYKNDLFAPSNSGVPENRFVKLFTTKHTDWQYEHEFRYISHRGPGIRYLKQCALKRVVLGCRFEDNPDAHKQELFDAIRKRNGLRPRWAQIRVATASRSHGNFTLRIKEDFRRSLSLRHLRRP